jgi:hypothetical protein
MKNLSLLFFLLALILIGGLSLAKIANQSKMNHKIIFVKTTISENTSPNHSHFHNKYTSPFIGEEDENEDEIDGFEHIKASYFRYSSIIFDENTLKNHLSNFDISDAYYNQVFSPPDFNYS